MNPNKAAKMKEEIKKLLTVGFLQPVKQATWLSLIVGVPKKNGKIKVCVDYRKLNTAMVTNAFPLPFIDEVLNPIVDHEVYNFLDGFRVTTRLECIRLIKKNDIRHRMGNVCCSSHDVRIKDNTTNISANHYGDFWRLYFDIHASFPS